MISRRAVLGAAFVGAGLGASGLAARQAGVLDDGLRAVGIRPHTEPDPRDVALLAEAADEQRDLLALLDRVAQQNGDAELTVVRRVLTDQLAAVSDDPAESPAPVVTPAPLSPDDDALASFRERVETVAAARADGAVSAGSLAVAKVLAAMAGGLDQVAVVIEELA